MTPRYTVWQWDQYNGWALYFGTSAYNAADQMKRALAAYQPQYYYGIYGSYALNAAFEIYGYWGTTRYSWGYSVGGDPAWIQVYALSKLMRPEIYVSARPLYSGASAGGGMPSWMGAEIAQRTRVAESYGTRIA